MKKNIQPLRTQPKTEKKLFGVSTDQLKAVHGGTGAVGNITTVVNSSKTGG